MFATIARSSRRSLHRARRRSQPRPRSRSPRGRLPLALGALLVGVGLAAASLVTPPPADAATEGRMITIGGWPVGAFRSSSGRYVYCLEPGAVEPSGAQKSARTVSELPAYRAYTFDQSGWDGTVASGSLSGGKLRQINYVLWEHGRTKSASTAVAVQLAVWMLRGDPGAKKWLAHHLDWVKKHGGQKYIDRAEEFVDEARRKAVAAAAPKPAPLKIEQGAEPGTGTVGYPAGTTRLSIDGGVFDEGGTTLKVRDGKAGRAAWRASPQMSAQTGEWRGDAEVSITGKWSLAARGWPAKVSLQPPVVALQQRLASGIGPVSSTFSGVLAGTERVESSFEPVLSTLVETRILTAGEDPFVDTVELDVAEGSNPWPSRRTGGETEFMPLLAEGTVYGPFEQPQSIGAEVPDGAPVAGNAVLRAERGPGAYRVESASMPSGSGYYYWVWRIREEDQPAELRSSGLLPGGYDFADDFGLADEGHVVPTALRWSTELARRELGVAETELIDRLAVRAEGGTWLRDEHGEPVPARIRFTAFHSESEPEQQAAAPEGARRIAERIVEVDAGAGDEKIRNDADDSGVGGEAGGGTGSPVQSVALELPVLRAGWVTVQACLREEDQSEEWRGHIEEWCDDYGVPAETAKLSASAPREAPEPEQPRRPRLAETGAAGSPGFIGAPRLSELSGLAAGLLGAGSAVLLVGGLLRSSTRRRSR